ncbi:MAG: TIGR02646 family protein [Sulfurovum sp.]
MKYIKKLNIPQFFINNTNGLTFWNDYYSTKKRVLKEYISKEEQNYLCCYCEDKIDINNSHIEHVKPKHLDIVNLTFDYYNLAVSCEGQCRNSEEDNTRYNCGHRKDKQDTQYDEHKFLSPLKIKDIREYFEYDNDANIIPSDKNIIKAQYMIDTLHLNDGDLPTAREDALKDLEELDIDLDELILLLEAENLAFISFLRYKYKNLI